MDTDDSSITHPSPLRVVNEDGATRLVLSGTVGVTEATDLHRAALDAVARPGRVVVDWSQADGIDTAIAQLLISLAAALKDDGRTLDLSPAPRGIEAFLHRVALHDTLLTQR